MSKPRNKATLTKTYQKELRKLILKRLQNQLWKI